MSEIEGQAELGDRSGWLRGAGAWLNVARGAKLGALLCFLLPWLTVSCSGQPAARMTGLGLATGTIEQIPSAATGLGGRGIELLGRASIVDPFVLEAANLILLALIVSFMAPRARAALISLALCAAAAALLFYELVVRLEPAIERQVARAAETAAGPVAFLARDVQRQAAEAISVRLALGFWLTLAALALACLCLGIAALRARAPQGP